MPSFGVARQAEHKIKPAFEIVKLEGTRTEIRNVFHPKERKIMAKEFDVPAGYMIRFAKGHSNRISQAELDRILAKTGNVIDMIDTESNEVVGSTVIDLGEDD